MADKVGEAARAELVALAQGVEDPRAVGYVLSLFRNHSNLQAQVEDLSAQLTEALGALDRQEAATLHEQERAQAAERREADSLSRAEYWQRRFDVMAGQAGLVGEACLSMVRAMGPQDALYRMPPHVDVADLEAGLGEIVRKFRPQIEEQK